MLPVVINMFPVVVDLWSGKNEGGEKLLWTWIWIWT
jgi:hypothetical protein